MVKGSARWAYGRGRIVVIPVRSCGKGSLVCSIVQLLSELALGRHGKSPFSEDLVRKLRDEVKSIRAREGIQFERETFRSSSEFWEEERRHAGPSVLSDPFGPFSKVSVVFSYIVFVFRF